ncbi:MAG: hypothetical protein IT529_07325 [Burkholderiales bacterium]|nr:hypothetical protein [Burkholderiales bacterium]
MASGRSAARVRPAHARADAEPAVCRLDRGTMFNKLRDFTRNLAHGWR